MFDTILVVCIGNICRSPMGERLLRAELPGRKIDSAGLSAVVGHGADETALAAAQEIGLSLEGHVARQLTGPLGAEYDLILVMEPGHRQEVMRRFPQLSGRTMLFDQWSGAKGISDPFRKPIEFHRTTRDRILAAAEGWAKRLKK